MQVLIDARTLSRGGRSGIPYYTKEVIQRLIAHPNDRFSLYYPGIRNQPLPNTWRADPRITIIAPKIPGRFVDIIHALRNTSGQIQQSKADVVYSPHINLIPTGGIPHVLTVHDISFAHHPQFFSIKQRYWHALQRWEKQLQSAAHLIAVSQYTKQDIMSTLGIAPERISVIYPGVDPSFEPLDVHDKKLITFGKRHSLAAPYILYFGALEARKNVLEVISAFDLLRTNPRFKDIELVLAGVPGFGADTIVRACQSSRSAQYIRILTGIADEERVLLYNGAIAFVYPSFFEGFGFPPLEAQACGIPTIISNRTSLTEIAGSSAISINPWKPSELADALALLVISASERARLRTQGIMNAKRFSWEQTADAVYTRITQSATNT